VEQGTDKFCQHNNLKHQKAPHNTVASEGKIALLATCSMLFHGSFLLSLAFKFSAISLLSFPPYIDFPRRFGSVESLCASEVIMYTRALFVTKARQARAYNYENFDAKLDCVMIPVCEQGSSPSQVT
jgi:hypothetical protein